MLDVPGIQCEIISRICGKQGIVQLLQSHQQFFLVEEDIGGCSHGNQEVHQELHNIHAHVCDSRQVLLDCLRYGWKQIQLGDQGFRLTGTEPDRIRKIVDIPSQGAGIVCQAVDKLSNGVQKTGNHHGKTQGDEQDHQHKDCQDRKEPAFSRFQACPVPELTVKPLHGFVHQKGNGNAEQKWTQDRQDPAYDIHDTVQMVDQREQDDGKSKGTGINNDLPAHIPVDFNFHRFLLP